MLFPAGPYESLHLRGLVLELLLEVAFIPVKLFGQVPDFAKLNVHLEAARTQPFFFREGFLELLFQVADTLALQRDAGFISAPPFRDRPSRVCARSSFTSTLLRLDSRP